MTSITIIHSPSESVALPCAAPFKIDIYESIKAKLSPDQQLTKDVAIRILKSIKYESDIKCFFTKTWVILSLTLLAIALTAVLPPFNAALLIITVLLGTVGSAMLGYLIPVIVSGNLSVLSSAYENQSKKAAEYIAKLENSKDALICFE